MVCDRCGNDFDTGDYDEDSGEFLCAICILEDEHCGCADEPEDEG